MSLRNFSALGAVTLVMGCMEPAAAVRAVWLDDSPQADGSYLLRVYDAGERLAFPVVPADPGSVPDQLLLDLGPGGGALVVGNTQDGVLFDLQSLRRVRVGPVVARVSAQNGITFSPLVSFSRSGDLLAVAEVDVDGVPESYLLRPLAHDPVVELQLPVPPAQPGGRWASPRTARLAPVLVLFHTFSSDVPVGEAVALRYPSHPTDAAALKTLARATDLQGRAVWQAQAPGLLSNCPGAACLDPEGTRLFFPSANCVVDRWSFDASGGEADEEERAHVPVPAETVALPETCLDASDPLLVAALDAQHLVLADNDRVYLAGLDDGTFESVPRPSRDSLVRTSRDGRVVLFIDRNGPVVAVDRFGPRILNATVSPCTGVLGPEPPGFSPPVGNVVVSPSGTWAAWTCITGEGGGYGGVTLRVSALGLEQLLSIPMQTLAIDDDGNLLLYSVDPDGTGINGEPRGLFVYGGDGELARVDGLSPTPGQYRMFGDDPYFDAAAVDVTSR